MRSIGDRLDRLSRNRERANIGGHTVQLNAEMLSHPETQIEEPGTDDTKPGVEADEKLNSNTTESTHFDEKKEEILPESEMLLDDPLPNPPEPNKQGNIQASLKVEEATQPEDNKSDEMDVYTTATELTGNEAVKNNDSILEQHADTTVPIRHAEEESSTETKRCMWAQREKVMRTNYYPVYGPEDPDYGPQEPPPVYPQDEYGYDISAYFDTNPYQILDDHQAKLGPFNFMGCPPIIRMQILRYFLLRSEPIKPYWTCEFLEDPHTGFMSRDERDALISAARRKATRDLGAQWETDKSNAADRLFAERAAAGTIGMVTPAELMSAASPPSKNAFTNYVAYNVIIPYPQTVRKEIFPAMMAAFAGNKELMEEATTILYGENVFNIVNAKVALWWLNCIGGNVSKIKSLLITVDEGVWEDGFNTRKEKCWASVFDLLKAHHKLQKLSVSFKHWTLDVDKADGLDPSHDADIYEPRYQLLADLLSFRGLKRAVITPGEFVSPQFAAVAKQALVMAPGQPSTEEIIEVEEDLKLPPKPTYSFARPGQAPAPAKKAGHAAPPNRSLGGPRPGKQPISLRKKAAMTALRLKKPAPATPSKAPAPGGHTDKGGDTAAPDTPSGAGPSTAASRLRKRPKK